MIIRVITWLIVVIVVYNLIGRYIMPIFRITSSTNDHIRQMHQKMKDMEQQMNNQNAANAKKAANSTIGSRRGGKDSDYVDYEEVK